MHHFDVNFVTSEWFREYYSAAGGPKIGCRLLILNGIGIYKQKCKIFRHFQFHFHVLILHFFADANAIAIL